MLYEQLCGGGLFSPLEEFWAAEAAAAARAEPSLVVAGSGQEAVAALEHLGRYQVQLGRFDLGGGVEPAIYYWPAAQANYACFARWLRPAELATALAANKAALKNGHFVSEHRLVLYRATLADGAVSVLRDA